MEKRSPLSHEPKMTELDDEYHTSRRKKKVPGPKGTKRRFPSSPEKMSFKRTTTESSAQDIEGEDEDDYFLNPAIDAPPLSTDLGASKSSKRLPTEEERAAELKHQPMAYLAAIVLECAKTVEKIAAASGNLKDTHKQFL